MNPSHPSTMSHFKSLLLIFACTLSAHAAPPMLVSPQEMADSEKAPQSLTAKFVPDKDAPRIEVIAPNLTAPVTSPTAVQLLFEATPPATVKPETFSVRYGALQIDITQRLLASARITAQSVSVDEANLPAGKHKLHLSVEDSMGRKGYRLVELQIN